MILSSFINIDSTGRVVIKYYYDAWGNVMSSLLEPTLETLVILNPLRYRSCYYDVETNLYYLNTRYYDSSIGRFITIDNIEYLDPEIVNGLNLYAYCLNNPVMYSDPTGHFGIALTLLIATGIGLAIGGGVEIGKQIYNGGNWNWDVSSWNWWEIGKSALLGAATGFAFGLGGVAGGIFKGTFSVLSIAGKSLSVYQSVGLLFGSALTTNFVSGLGGYAMHVAGSPIEDFNIINGVSEAFGQTGKGLFSFFTAGMFVSSGIWNVGAGAKNTLFSTLIARPVAQYIMNFLPNYFFENAF